MKIITNNVPRDVIEAYELTSRERKEFDYRDWKEIDEGRVSATFVRYKGELIDLEDLERSLYCDSPLYAPFEWLKGWDGYRSDTFFSGVLVRYVDDFERVIMGRYYS